MKYLKIAYLCLAITYITLIVIHLLSFEISYRIVGVRPGLLKERSLTFEEHKNLERAQKIRNNISRGLLYFSVLIAITSAALWYFKPYPVGTFIKIMFFLSLFWVLLLIVVSGIKFIPTPPIR